MRRAAVKRQCLLPASDRSTSATDSQVLAAPRPGAAECVPAEMAQAEEAMSAPFVPGRHRHDTIIDLIAGRFVIETAEQHLRRIRHDNEGS